MTYEHSFADSQWRSGPQPAAIVNWPPIEKDDTMTIKALEEAITEANRFLIRARALSRMHKNETVTDSILDHPKEQGAVRRASMDLTRSLADLRG